MVHEAANSLLICSLEPLERGQQYDVLPLHVTVEPWFYLDSDREPSLGSSLINLGHDLTPISARACEDNDIPARRVRSMGKLAMLHDRLTQLVERRGGVISSPWVGEKYSPHVTYLEDGSGLDQDEEIELKAIQLVRCIDDDLSLIHI